MKTRTNNNSFGNIEIILGISILLVVLVIIANSVISLNNNDKYKDIESDANTFIEETLKDANEEENETGNIFYLKDVSLKSNKLNNIKNNCDLYDSYVEIGTTTKVRLSCSDYLLEGTYKNTFYIYEIGSWTKDDTIGETAFFYNYKKEDKEVLKDYLSEREFIETYNKNEETEVTNLDLLNEDAKEKQIEVVSDIFYREKKLVKEL